MKRKISIRLVCETVAVICACVLFPGCASTSPDLSQQEQQPDVPPPVAKSGPSFEETRDWLVVTLNQYGGENDGRGVFWTVYSNVAISNSGILTFIETEYQSDYESGSKPFWARRITIPLGAISNIHTEQGVLTGDQDTGINIATGNSAAITFQPVGKYEDNANIAGRPSNVEFIWMESVPKSVAGQPMPSTPQEMAKRFATALQHMVDICKNAYNAPTQATQPF